MNSKDLINRAIQGDLSATETADFVAALKSNTALRKDFLDTLSTDHLLAEYFGKAAPESVNIAPKITAVRPRYILLTIAAAIALLVGLRFAVSEKNMPATAIVDAPVDLTWQPGDTRNFAKRNLEVTLARGINARFESNAAVKLRDTKGRIELLSGIGHFNIRKADQEPGFEVYVAGRIVRDIGTDFTVVTDGTNYGEVHVSSGSISITTPGEAEDEIVHAGDAVRWLGNLPSTSIDLSDDPSSLAVSESIVLLADDFNDANETAPDGKPSDIGEPWRFISGASPQTHVKVRNGAYDTTGGPCSLSAAFPSRYFSESAGSVFSAKLELQAPDGQLDPASYPEGEASLLFHNDEGRPVLAIEALFRNENRWSIVNPQTGERSALSSLKASEKGSMEFTFDFTTGRLVLLAGNGSSSEPVSLSLPPGLRLEQISIENRAGSDIRIDSISLSVMNFSEKNPLSD